MKSFYDVLICNDRFWILWLEIDKIHKKILLFVLEFNQKLDNMGYLYIFNTSMGILLYLYIRVGIQMNAIVKEGTYCNLQ